MRVGWYLPGITPEKYRSYSAFDRMCLNEALDDWLERRQGDTIPTDGSLTGLPPSLEDKEL